MNAAGTAAGSVRQVSAQKRDGLMLAFYGDDFTGSTDALDFLSRAGVKTVLFTEPPSPEMLGRYPGLQAIGIAGMTRSMPPEEMEGVLRPALTVLKQLDVPHVHYKVCSTFDSSPATGSIGKAIEIGAGVFSREFIPLLVAAPALGRYCLFGNLFARFGTGEQGAVFRLDRHPSMSRHPVTPSDESDLRLHLSRQTRKKTGLLDILQLSLGGAETRRAVESMIRGGDEVILFDALYENQLPGIGELIDAYAGTNTLFSVGSSGIEMALGAFWTAQGRLQPVRSWTDPGKAESLLVISGSCSPVTQRQLSWALAHDFSGVVLDDSAFRAGGRPAGSRPPRGSGPATDGRQPADGRHPKSDAMRLFIENHAAAVISLLKKGRKVILHTGEPAASPQGNPVHFGTVLGRIAKEVAANVRLQRLVIAGGDTSSYAARELGIRAVEMIAPVVPGAPLCRAFAPGSPADGMEVNFKGGQVGAEDYFGKVLSGGSGG